MSWLPPERNPPEMTDKTTLLSPLTLRWDLKWAEQWLSRLSMSCSSEPVTMLPFMEARGPADAIKVKDPETR